MATVHKSHEGSLYGNSTEVHEKFSEDEWKVHQVLAFVTVAQSKQSKQNVTI